MSVVTRRLFALGLMVSRAFSARARPDLYKCDGCAAALERDPANLSWRVQIESARERGERLILEGTVRHFEDGTPAANVVIYAHQTNADGLYANGSADTIWSRRHGRLRGWVKTDRQGRYRFDTIKPAPYPNKTMPAHIHLFVAEPGFPPYYIDDVVFSGEFGVTADYRERQELRGGSGVAVLRRGADGVLVARRDILLEPHPRER